MQYIKYFLSTALIIIFFFFVLGLFLQPLNGDLTRIGNYSENDFGWNARQPQIAVKGSVHEITPDVIVLGDSFSAGNIWQSVVMEKRGGNILTFPWKNPNALEYLVTSLKKTYPTTKYLVIETVEREFIPRFNTPQNLTGNQKEKPVIITPYKTASIRDTSTLHPMHDPVYAIQATVNSLKKNDKTSRSGLTIITPLNRKGLFSNRKSDLLIYYTDDDRKKNWNYDEIEKAVANIRRLRDLAERSGITLIMVVVPDKSTAYGQFFKSAQFRYPQPDVWAELDKQGVAQVNLKKILIPAVGYTQDLYYPNDTHLGVKGFTLMGEAISNRLNYIESISKK